MLDVAKDRLSRQVGRAHDDMEHKLAEHRRAIIDEAVSREDALRAQVEALGKEAATLRTLLADAVRGTEESP